MGDQYGPATVTPLNEVKREQPRINGHSAQAVITAKSLPPPTSNNFSTDQLTTMVKAEEVVSAPVPEPYWASSREQQCCLVEYGRRCQKPAGNASYSKRIQKTVAQKKLKLHMDNSVSY